MLTRRKKDVLLAGMQRVLFALFFVYYVVVATSEKHLFAFASSPPHQQQPIGWEERKTYDRVPNTVFSVPPFLDDFPSQHEDNWAVIVSSSKYWHNFRQSNNAFLIYNQLRSNGIPDERIILFVSENHACDKRNPDIGYSSCMRSSDFPNSTVFGADVEIDFEGYGADAQAFLRVLLDTQSIDTPATKRLRSTNKSNVFLFIASHSGEYFTKFQDYEFLSAFELSHTLQQMHRLGRYHRLLFVVDTCKATTLFELLDAPNVVSISSSGPTDDGMSHESFFNYRVMAVGVDALSSELFDFVALDMMRSQEKRLSIQKARNQKTARTAITNKQDDRDDEADGDKNSLLLVTALEPTPMVSKKTTLRNLFDFLRVNRKIRSRVSMSHSRDLFLRNHGASSDVLGNGNWLLRDFFADKKKTKVASSHHSEYTSKPARGDEASLRGERKTPKKPSVLDEMDRDTFFWEELS